MTDDQVIQETQPNWSPVAVSFSILIALTAIGLTGIYWIQPDALAALTLVPAWAWLIPIGIAYVLLVRSQRARRDNLFDIGTINVSCKRLMLVTWAILIVLHVEEPKSLIRTLLPASALDSDRVIRVATLNCNIGNANALREVLKLKADIYLFQESPGNNVFLDQGVGGPKSSLKLAWGGDTSVVFDGELKPVLIEQKSYFTHVMATLSNGLEVDIVSLRLLPPIYRVDIWNVEFWRDHKNRRHDHRLQIMAIRKHLAANQQTKNLILGGDFNAVPSDGAIRQSLMGLKDSFAQSGIGWGHTGTNRIPLFRVDQIWASDSFKALESKSIASKFSDHRMVTSAFTVE